MEKVTVVKVGGAIVEDSEQLAQLLKDFAAIPGKKVLVHGGPKFRIQQIISSLTLPNLVHFGESIFYAGHWEELVFCAVDEKHRLRAGEGGDMRIVEILPQPRNAIRKTAILLSSESPGKLSVRSNHPADRSTRLDSIR